MSAVIASPKIRRPKGPSPWWYLLPALLAMFAFIAFPLLYTLALSTTNYSSAHLLTYERAKTYLLSQNIIDGDQAVAYTLARSGQQYVLQLEQVTEQGKAQFRTEPFSLAGVSLRNPSPTLTAQSVNTEPLPAMSLRDVVALRDSLAGLSVAIPSATGDLKLRYAGPSEFAPDQPLYTARDNGIVEARTGKIFFPNEATGYFETRAEGSNEVERLQPGFRVGIGAKNYTRLFSDPDIRGPFVSIFVWTVLFAALTVLFTTTIGMTLATLLDWEALKFRGVYRVLLFLPYAVPGFISILVFKGLFNQNFGEINAIINALFGVKPAWFADPLLAKIMLLIVNTWLGFPYIMILCSGLLKSIPADLYEASAIAGAKPLAKFRRITFPLVIKPLTPLLVAAFAFNFNNFVLISLLTDGRPDFLNTKVPAGTNDILVSYTYRIAFTDAGQNFGFAAAISTLIFVLVAVISWFNLRALNSNKGAQ